MNIYKKINPSFFIIGNPRSGTTLLRLMLTTHPKVIIPPECSFLTWLYPKYEKYNQHSLTLRAREQILSDIIASKKFDTWKLNSADLMEFFYHSNISSYNEFCSLVYEFYRDKYKKNAVLIGDKNNIHLEHIKTLASMSSKSKFLHIIRDGRDVACSYRKVMKKNYDTNLAPTLPTDIAEMIEQWVSNINIIELSLSKLDASRVKTIRFEDLVQKPQDTLEGVCMFLDIRYDPKMLSYYIENKRNELEPKELMPWKMETLKAVNVDRIGSYKSDLSSQEQSLFVLKSGQLLSRYRYI